MKHVIIYLHGFLSSPKSEKATLTKEFVNTHYPDAVFEVPQLSNYPAEAAFQIKALVEKHKGQSIGFIGSSMGGFLSTHMAEAYGRKAVLINPAVAPYHLLQDYLGEHVNPYTDIKFTLTQQHVEELMALDTQDLREPSSYYVMLQTGDETLNYQDAEAKYREGSVLIEEGGDHSFVNYEAHLPNICKFLLS